MSRDTTHPAHWTAVEGLREAVEVVEGEAALLGIRADRARGSEALRLRAALAELERAALRAREALRLAGGA